MHDEVISANRIHDDLSISFRSEALLIPARCETTSLSILPLTMTRAKSAAHVHRLLQPIKNSLYIGVDYSRPPAGLRWRSSTLFILATVGVGLSTDLFLYGLVVPILPFMLQERLHLPPSQIQSHVDGLLAAYAGASMLFSPVAGYIADRTSSRQLPFLTGLLALLAATVLLDLAQSLSVLFLARVLQGVSAAVVWTVGLALCLDTVGPDNLGKVIGSVCGNKMCSRLC